MQVRAKEVLEAALAATGMNQSQLAKLIGTREQSLGQKVNIRESVRANEFFDMLEAMGIETQFVVKETGKMLFKSAHRRVKGMSDNTLFDTKEASFVATSFYADGVNEFGPDGKAQDMYIDSEGRYFVAEYTDDPAKDRVKAVPVNMAEAFIKIYGREGRPKS